MSELKYKIGDRVRIKSLDWYNENKDEIGDVDCGSQPFIENMIRFCGKTLTISQIDDEDDCYFVEEDDKYAWTDDMIEGLASETVDSIEINAISFKSNLKYNRVTISSVNCADEVEVYLDDDYEVVYRDGKMFAIKKKPKYPTTYDECLKVLGFDSGQFHRTGKNGWYKWELIAKLDRLLLCRNAYWKIAGEEMGLGKPWEPDWNNISDKYCVYFVSGYAWSKECQTRQCPFAFPTAEMRDAFKENFDKDLEFCKELL